MKQTILVTGGTGYIGSWVVKYLLESGHNVRMPVRDLNNKEKYDFLVDISELSPGKLELFEADLLKMGSYDKAAEGCDTIIHVASPFILKVKDPQKELVDPAVKGTENVLGAASRSKTVKKVVLTSSVAAVYGDNADMGEQGLEILTEEHFNKTSSLSHQPYSFSKVEAEKKAWEIAGQQSQWKLVVLNPSFVVGPPLSTTTNSESIKLINDILSGKLRTGVAELYFGFVDVRDVARAHIYCAENGAQGRHILSERVTDLLSMVNIIRDYKGNEYKLPKSNNPKWLMGLIGGLFGITRKFVNRNIGIPLKLDSTKSREKLHLTYTPLEETMKDMVDKMSIMN